MASRHNFRKVEIWKEGITLSLDIYQYTKNFPTEEKYGLSSQLQRASVSIPSNISEGTSRGTDKHFVQFLQAALGSAYELESQLIIAFKLNYLTEQTFNIIEKQIHKLQGMIATFIDKLSQ